MRATLYFHTFVTVESYKTGELQKPWLTFIQGEDLSCWRSKGRNWDIRGGHIGDRANGSMPGVCLAKTHKTQMEMEESNDDLTLDFFYLYILIWFYHVCLCVFLLHKGVQLSVPVGFLVVSRSPGICLRCRSGRTPRLAKLQQTGRWLLGKLPNKAPNAGTTKT